MSEKIVNSDERYVAAMALGFSDDELDEEIPSIQDFLLKEKEQERRVHLTEEEKEWYIKEKRRSYC